MKDADDVLIALIYGESQELIKDQMNHLQMLLKHLDPTAFEPIGSMDAKGFTSIHCDTYNRFAEKVRFPFAFLSE